MSSSLWPNLSTVTPPRGIREMLYDAAGDIDVQTGGSLQFYVDTLGVGPSGIIKNVRHDCYLRVATTGYLHLLFRVTTPAGGPWPASTATPEGEREYGLKDESELRVALQRILERERTKEVVFYLMSTVR